MYRENLSMNIYNYLIDDKENIDENLKRKHNCFIDIETTGLNKNNNIIYLIGVLYYSTKNHNWYIKQFFANDLDEEEKLLSEFIEFINKFDTIVTFNGETFDIPFLRHRLNIYNIENKMDDLISLDLYKKIKSNSSYLNLRDYKLKTIERSLGIYRNDKYSGKDCIKFFYQYLKTKDENLLNNILKHNYDDLYYLIDIYKMLDIIENIKTINIQLHNEKIIVKIDKITIDKDIFSIMCKSSTRNNIVYYGDGFNIRWEENNLYIDLETKKGLITPTEKCIFIDTSLWPPIMGFKDLSKYSTPNDIILLKVENKFVMENIKEIIKRLVLFIQ